MIKVSAGVKSKGNSEYIPAMDAISNVLKYALFSAASKLLKE